MHAPGILERIAWAAGIAALASYAGARIVYEHARAAGVDDFHAAQVAETSLAATPVPEPIDRSLWSAARSAAFVRSSAAPGTPQALLRLPSLGLEVPVYAGLTPLNLNRGAAHIEGTAPPGANGNVGIAAHRDGFFRQLKDARIGDAIELSAADGTRTYRVVELAVVAPEDVGVLAPTPAPAVTLVTCFPFYFAGHAPRRYIVRGELVERPPPAAAAGSASTPGDDAALLGRQPERSKP